MKSLRSLIDIFCTNCNEPIATADICAVTIDEVDVSGLSLTMWEPTLRNARLFALFNTNGDCFRALRVVFSQSHPPATGEILQQWLSREQLEWQWHALIECRSAGDGVWEIDSIQHQYNPRLRR